MGDVRAILCGYYGKGNSGDEALLASLLQMLPAQVQPIVLSGNPQETYDRYGVISCDRNSGFRILEAMGESEYFLWGGGSLMQDATSWQSPLYYGGLMGLAQQRGLKTIAWAQGIGPLKRRLTRWLTRQTLLGCAAVSVRDRASAQLLQQWQITPLLAPDPVWALDPQPYPGLGDIHAPRVAVILRPHPHLTRQRFNHLTQALISFQKATDTSLLLLPFHPSQDLEMADAIARQLPGIHHILTPDNPRQLMSIFDGVELAIGMRLHGLIM
ncbi:MAG: polysaccharide pyruvyl transferase CsaB, partial [Kamptonema sp. SIO4C4]|nr:polysaccharide pyruvyl transferase CsaB [Kamptonema sp. SIO4C4]